MIWLFRNRVFESEFTVALNTDPSSAHNFSSSMCYLNENNRCIPSHFVDTFSDLTS